MRTGLGMRVLMRVGVVLCDLIDSPVCTGRGGRRDLRSSNLMQPGK